MYQLQDEEIKGSKYLLLLTKCDPDYILFTLIHVPPVVFNYWPEVCDDGIQVWTVYDWQPENTLKSVCQELSW